jgi:ferric-dicitrate binding protein FerR (iron transport regulator)
MKKEFLKYDDLLTRYLEGRLVDSEYDRVTDILKDVEAREYFEKFKQQWELVQMQETRVDASLERLKARLSLDKNLNRTLGKSRSLFVVALRYAAVLLVGLVLGGTGWYFFDRSEKSIFPDRFVLETPRGEKSKITLPDGSEVWLNAKSRLEYNGFTASSREVKLSGEGFFRVAHNEEVPFHVRTNDCDIKVVGTEFNVMAYDEFGREEVTLISGKVHINTPEQETDLLPGECAILRENRLIKVQSGKDQAMGWVDNKFNFVNVPLSELVTRLENWYDVDIELVNKKNKQIRFTGVFKNEETIWQVLDAVKVYIPIEYEKTNLRKIKVIVK